MKIWDTRGAGWTSKLADAVENASQDDVVLVESEAARDLGRRAQSRIRRPGMALKLEVVPLGEIYPDGSAP